MQDTLSAQELLRLLHRTLHPRPGEDLAVLVDLPDARQPDRPVWARRRAMALEWVRTLRGVPEGALHVDLYLYRNVRRANGDLPSDLFFHPPEQPLPPEAESLAERTSEPLESVLSSHPLVLAPTEFSATAPLKILAPRLGFRGATLPGFTAGMIPALRLDPQQVAHRVQSLARLLDQAQGAFLTFRVDDLTRHSLFLDLRHRTAHRSDGRFAEPGQVGNLPAGEAYIVPYEGEGNSPSRTEGEMPVEFPDGLVCYTISGNRAIGVRGEEPARSREEALIGQEPAYGNLAEMGLGVLGELGIAPQGEVLLDEKIGLHLAFGRSDHFGGATGPAAFRDPASVVHIDRVYVPALQPRIVVETADLEMSDGSLVPLMREGRYTVPW